MRRLHAFAALAAALPVPGAALAQASPSPYTSAVRYDAMGRVTGTISADPDGAGGNPFIAVRNSYDGAGRLVRVETGTLSAWRSEAVAPADWGPAFAAARSVETRYDALGRKSRETLREGQIGLVHGLTQYSYDVIGRLECTAVRMNPDHFGAPLPDERACDPGPESQSFGPDRIARNFYDTMGQRLQLREGVGTDVEAAGATWAYNANGQVTTVIDGNGNRAELHYDGHGRQDRWTFPSPSRPAAFNDATPASALATAGAVNTGDYEEYGYDAAGNRTSLRKRDGSVLTYQYDALNRMILKLVPERTGLTAAQTRDVHYGYDLRNLQLYARFDSPSGEGVTNAWGGFGRLTWSRVDLGGVTRTLGYAYDRNGSRTRITHPDGQYFSYRHDGLDRFAGIRENGASDVVSQYYHPTGERYVIGRTGAATGFLYDDAGRLRYQVNDLPGTAGVSWTFTRNPAAQITSAERSNDLYAWTGHYGVSRIYATNGLNQYSRAASTTAAGPGTTSFAYDLNGNLTGDGSRTYAYDIENRLVAVGGTGSASLAYDPLGRLYEVSGGASAPTRFLYDGDALVAEYDGAGTLLRRYVHGAGVDEPLLWYEGAGVSWQNRRQLFADQQGSIVAVTDAYGNNPAINRYDEYGIPAATNSGRFQYTGQIWIAELGMYHYKARAYSPTLGRFLQVDPIGYEDQFNLYAYVGDDPVNRSDPSGAGPWQRFSEWWNTPVPGTRRYEPSEIEMVRPEYANCTCDVGTLTNEPMTRGEIVLGAGEIVGTALPALRDARLGRATAPIEVTVRRSAHPQAAAHIERAQAAGHPRTLTVDRAGARSRRAEALRDHPRRAGTDRDEYPPAMFREGGRGGSVENIRRSDNRGWGASMGRQCRHVRNGERVTITVCH